MFLLLELDCVQFLSIGADGGDVVISQKKSGDRFLRLFDVDPDVRGVVAEEFFVGPDEGMCLADDVVGRTEQEAHREDSKKLN
jgi:hypothetical protein